LKILAACIDKEELMKQGIFYLTGNIDMAVDCLTVIDSIREKIQATSKLSLKNLSNCVTPPPPLLTDENVPESKASGREFKTAIAMLGESTFQGYDRLRRSIIINFKISASLLSSYYMKMKYRLRIESFIIKLQK